MRYFRLFKCSKNFLNNLDATYERGCLATFPENWNTSVLRYVRSCMLDKKEKYYTKLSNTITNFNDIKNTPLSIMYIQ